MGIKLDKEVVDSTLDGMAPSTEEVVSYLDWYLDSIQTLAYNKKTMKRDRIPNGFQQSWWLWHFGIEHPTWKEITIFDWRVADILNSLGSHSFGGGLKPRYYPPAFLNKTDIIKREGAFVGGEFSSTIFYEAISDQEDNITFKKISGASWLKILPNGIIQGIPTYEDIGENNFTVAVVGSKGDMDTKKLSVTVDRYEHKTFLSTDDTICKKANPQQNFSSDKSATLIASSKDTAQMAYLKFNINTVKTIKSAKLRVYIVGRNVYLNIYKLQDNSWTEATISWQNRPITMEKLTTVKINSKSGDYFDIDLSSTIKENGIYSFVIETTKKDAEIYFKESLKKPKLILELE